MGPSAALGLEPYFILFFFGQGLNGFAQGFFFAPALPEVIDAVYTKQKLVEGADEILDNMISDKASGYYWSFFAFGSITAPLVGSAIYEQAFNRNWAATCDVFATLGAIFATVYLVFNIMPDIHLEKVEVQEAMEKMIEEPATREKLKSVFDKDRGI